MSMKNSNDTIGNRTRNLPAFSAVPQPIVPPRTPKRRACNENTCGYFIGILFTAKRKLVLE